MSFGVYRPSMGVAGGCRELCSDLSFRDQCRLAERNARQENPITHEPLVRGAPGRPPSGNLRAGLVPVSGPVDSAGILPNKDLPAKRVDPTKNQSSSFHTGVSCVPQASSTPRATVSRITESSFGEGLMERAPTPEQSSRRSSRRSTPGQVVRAGSRPKDSLSGGGCITSDLPSEHPLALPRKPGSESASVGSGGAVHIVPGPTGFVPMGLEDDSLVLPQSQARRAQEGRRPYQRMCGVSGDESRPW